MTGDFVFNGDRDSFEEGDKVLEADGDDGCSAT